MYIKERSKKRVHKHGRDQMAVTLIFTPSDVKKALQRHLKELQLYGLPNKFRESDLLEFYRQHVFQLMPEKHAVIYAEWAYDVSIDKGYVTSNRWDKEQPTIYFINPDILKLRPGPTGPRTAKGMAALEKKKLKEQEREKEE